MQDDWGCSNSLRDWIGFAALQASGFRRCPMCEDRLRSFEFWSAINKTRWSALEGTYARIFFCGRCGFWFSDEQWSIDYEEGPDDTLVTLSMGSVARYRLDEKAIALPALRQYLSRHPEHVAHTNPTAFEKLMAECLRDEFVPCEVTHLGQTADGGVDIKLVTSDREVWLVQVKRRASISASESVQVVRELNGVLFREGLAKGLIITTAQRFTRSARQETAVKTRTRGQYEIQLRSFGDVCRMLRLPSQTPYQPWLSHLTLSPKSHASYLDALRTAPYFDSLTTSSRYKEWLAFK
jgi:hypothetical protein